MKIKPKNHNFFEAWARRNGMFPIRRVAEVKVNGVAIGDVLLADSRDLIAGSQYPPMVGQEHGMFAFYRTGFAIDRPDDKTWFAFYNDYPSDAFAEYSVEGRQQKRLEEALKYAIEAIHQTHGVGLYDGRRAQVH